MKLKVQVKNEFDDRVDIKELREGKDYIVTGKRKMKLMRELWFFHNNQWIHLNSGFNWNGASIPGAFWFFIGEPTEQKFALASLVHDYLYKIKYNRDRADCIFKMLLDWAGVNGKRVALMWAAVRLGGQMFYAARADNDKWTTQFWKWSVKKLYGNE